MVKKKKTAKKKTDALLAKRDFIINHPPHYFVKIAKGDNLKELGVPERYYNQLKLEEVI